MHEIMLELQPHLITIAVTLLSAFTGWLGMKVKAFLDTKEKRLIVEATVKYVEQVGKTLGGDEKLALAKTKALEWMNTKGFSISEIELDILIESTVNDFFKHYELIKEPTELSEVDMSDESAHLLLEESEIHE